MAQKNAVRFTIIGSVLAGLGLGGAVAALNFVLGQITFGHPVSTDNLALESLAVFGVYGAIVAVTAGVVFGLLQGVRHLAGGSEKVSNGILHGLSAISGISLGIGLLFWHGLLLFPDRLSNWGALGFEVVAAGVSSAIVYGIWTGVSQLAGLRGTDEGKVLTSNLATTSSSFALLPFIYLIIVAIVSTIR